MDNSIFSQDFEVRDYECDIEGIVNNSVYQNYLEHCRHKFLISKGFSFAELTSRGLLLIVIRVEIDYKFPLRSGDSFRVNLLELERVSPVRFCFHQNIIRDDGKLIVRAKVFGAAMNERGRPVVPRELDGLLPEDD
jgi:acyl-CoA thioester hydrolase